MTRLQVKTLADFDRLEVATLTSDGMATTVWDDDGPPPSSGALIGPQPRKLKEIEAAPWRRTLLHWPHFATFHGDKSRPDAQNCRRGSASSLQTHDNHSESLTAHA